MSEHWPTALEEVLYDVTVQSTTRPSSVNTGSFSGRNILTFSEKIGLGDVSEGVFVLTEELVCVVGRAFCPSPDSVLTVIIGAEVGTTSSAETLFNKRKLALTNTQICF